MTVVVTSYSLLFMLRWVRCVLFTAGLSLLAWCGYVLLDARAFQAEGNRLIATGAASVPPAADLHTPQPVAPVSPASFPAPTAAKNDVLIGRLEIPRLGLSAIIAEGSDARTLRRAIGHIPGTALPGESGNATITGHRDTFFRPLREILRDDRIVVTTFQGEYEYRVVLLSIVGPDDIAVLRSDEGESLTLITCYPFTFLGPAPRRLVVRAERVVPVPDSP